MNQPIGVQKFSSKSEAYIKGRPAYSSEGLDFIIRQVGLESSMVVADIGAGTGILTRDLESRFHKVIAIEPNDDMRSVLGPKALKGTAENTGLLNESVDAIFAAQAFHWFEPKMARTEFRRILKSPKPVILLWNERQTPSGSGAAALDSLMQSLRTQIAQALEANESAIQGFFESKVLNKAEFENPTFLDKDELQSMVLSRSYAPRKNEYGYRELIRELDSLFEKHAINGLFSVGYKTQIYWGYIR